jgi:gas vesicle protein
MEENNPPLESTKKEEQGEKKKGSRILNLLFGVIVGGAVGSVLGVTLAPKSGEENRKFIKEKSKEFFKKGSEFVEEKYKGITKKEKKSFWHWIHDIFYRKK